MDARFSISQDTPSGDEYRVLRQNAASSWPWNEKTEGNPVQRADHSATVRLKDTGELAGFGSVQIRLEGVELEFYDLLVKHAYQGNGIGSLISEEILDWYQEFANAQGRESTAVRGKVVKGRNSFFEQFGFITIYQYEESNEMKKTIWKE